MTKSVGKGRNTEDRAKPGDGAGIETSAAVADWLRERIRNGTLPPGRRLVEADLVQRLNASRLRVREALRRLETEGLVEVQEFRAAFVKAYSKAEILALNQAREVLEGLAARLAAESDQTPAFRQGLADIQAAMDNALRRGAVAEYGRLNQDFHRLILLACGNPFVIDAVERLRTPVVRLQLGSLLGTMAEQQNRDHHHITQALLARDADGAERAMRDHIRNGGIAIGDIPERDFTPLP